MNIHANKGLQVFRDKVLLLLISFGLFLALSSVAQGASSPTVTTGSVSGLSYLRANLNAVSNPNGSSTVGWFRYSTVQQSTCNDTFGSRAPIATGVTLGSGIKNVSFTQSISVLPNTRYYYCAIASNTTGISFGAIMTFLTPPGLPNAVTNVVATNVSGSSNSVTWTDNASDETSVSVSRRTNMGTPIVIATLPKNTTSFIDTTASPNNTYMYIVRAYNVSGGRSTASNNVVTATIIPSDPFNLVVYATSSPNGIGMYWGNSSNNEEGFKIERSSDNITFTEIGMTNNFWGSVSGSFLDTLAIPGTYYYRIYAYNAIGNSGNSNTETVIIP